jgi:RNA polymerase sigma-70 factor (ECF subfamily)
MDDGGDSDETLIERYARGDVQAFESLYERHEMRVWRYLVRNVGSRETADELLQEVWFAVARDANRYRPSSKFTTWLFTIAHNRMIDSVRARRPQVSLETLGLESEPVVEQLTSDPGTGPLAAAVARHQTVAILQAVKQLPAEQRNAFLMQVEGDLSVEEIAAITHSSFETTKSRLRYARTKLRELLGEFA